MVENKVEILLFIMKNVYILTKLVVGTQNKANLIQTHGRNDYFLKGSHPPFN